MFWLLDSYCHPEACLFEILFLEISHHYRKLIIIESLTKVARRNYFWKIGSFGHSFDFQYFFIMPRDSFTSVTRINIIRIWYQKSISRITNGSFIFYIVNCRKSWRYESKKKNGVISLYSWPIPDLEIQNKVIFKSPKSKLRSKLKISVHIIRIDKII